MSSRTTLYEGVRLPIRAGDAIGLDCCGSPASVAGNTSGATSIRWNPGLADGAPPRPPTSTDTDREVLFNADVERDADGDAHGDETQDVCFTNPSTQGACPAPTISGTAQNGQTLTASPGGSPNNPSFQWLRCDAAGDGCTSIPGATGSSYTLSTEDVGRTIRIRQAAQNASGSQTADSAPTAVVELAPGPCANAFAGTDGPDALNGSLAGDSLIGLGGDDSINGVQGDDCLDAGDGDDVGSGGEGGDLLAGGAGVDRLIGDFGADVMRGDAGDDNLAGGSDRDRLTGGAGEDVLSGGGDKDRLSGGADKDRLSGGAGNDRLTGGPGTNRYSGGGGNDVVNAINGRRERVNCGPGRRDKARVDGSDRVRGCERVLRIRRDR